MKLRFVSLTATDTVMLPGLLYEPTKATRKVVVWLHGMGDNAVFYKPLFINTLGQALTAKNIALLAFNNRGAHSSKHLKLADDSLPEEDRDYRGGTYYELVRDCVKDIDGAVSFLQEQGFKELYLAGHSTGANKVCVYDTHAVQKPFSKYVLAGPGDDTGSFFTELGEEKFNQAMQYAARKLASNKPLQIMPKYTGMYPFSAQSAHDILNPDGDYNTFPFYEATTRRIGHKPLFKEYAAINKPLQVIFGAEDEYAVTAGGAAAALELMRGQTQSSILPQSDFQLIAAADHSFHGQEAAFANHMTEWLPS